MAKSTYYDLIYEDESIVIINKQLQVLSIPDRFRPELPNVYKLLEEKYGEIYTVHRLDRETSGIMCFARTRSAHKHLSQQFQDRQTDKKYLAIVDGCPYPEEGQIDGAIGKHPTKAGLMKVVSKGGKASLTHYKVLESFKQCSLVEATILTGRTHQIRVHFQQLGHPMLVDENYGGKKAFYLSEIKKRKFNLGKFEEERPILSRVPLHAFSLSFTHPVDGGLVRFEAAPPKDIRALLNQLRKWNKK